MLSFFFIFIYFLLIKVEPLITSDEDIPHAMASLSDFPSLKAFTKIVSWSTRAFFLILPLNAFVWLTYELLAKQFPSWGDHSIGFREVDESFLFRRLLHVE